MNTILLIEDNHINQMVTAAMLRALEIHCVVAGSVADARALLRQEQDYQLVLTDIELPDGDSITWVREYVAGGGRLPVVAMTGALKNRYSREACLDAGMVGYLEKPFTLDQLRQVLQRHLCER